jgi:hypothetical protein
MYNTDRMHSGCACLHPSPPALSPLGRLPQRTADARAKRKEPDFLWFPLGERLKSCIDLTLVPLAPQSWGENDEILDSWRI